MVSVRPDRLPWIDHLRTGMIMLVVNLHACVSYSHVGDWYFMSEREPTLAAKVPFILWEGHLQAFFMGLLFFIAGYFAEGSLARRGPASFVRERLFRLGVPALFYMLVIHPFIVLALNPWQAKFAPAGAFYLEYLRTGRFLRSSGPLWFAVALLLFGLVLAVTRALRPLPSPKNNVPAIDDLFAARPPGAAPTPVRLALAALVLSLATFGVRLLQPIGTNVLNFQLCFFVQYVAFFAAGLHAARHGWLLALARSTYARTAGWVALIGGPIVLLLLLVVGGRNASVQDFMGGWHWQALGFAVWEQFAGVGLSLGALSLFSRKLDGDAPGWRWLGERSFAVYVFHAPVLVALAMWFRALPQNMYALAALLTVSGLVVTYAIADVVRRVPAFRRVF